MPCEEAGQALSTASLLPWPLTAAPSGVTQDGALGGYQLSFISGPGHTAEWGRADRNTCVPEGAVEGRHSWPWGRLPHPPTRL